MAKENWIVEQCKGIEDILKTNNSKQAYQQAKDLTCTKKHLPRRIITDVLEDLCVAEGIEGLTGDEQEFAKLVERLSLISAAYGIEKSAKKPKLMTNNTDGIIIDSGEKRDTVNSFKYLTSVVSNEGSKTRSFLQNCKNNRCQLILWP